MDLKRNKEGQVKCALSVKLSNGSAYNDLTCYATPKDILCVMGYAPTPDLILNVWADNIITLLEQGKPVYCTSNRGSTVFIPLLEDGELVSRDIVYFSDGSIYSRAITPE